MAGFKLHAQDQKCGCVGEDWGSLDKDRARHSRLEVRFEDQLLMGREQKLSSGISKWPVKKVSGGGGLAGKGKGGHSMAYYELT